jgi:GTP-binding protein
MKVLGAERVASAATPEAAPRPGAPEIAFAGRSNVGKSSLLNRLAGRRDLAHTSATPGKTRLLHFYEVRYEHARRREALLFVDLPGYGWARVSRAERAGWRRLVEGYLEDRPSLRGVFVLIDVRRDPGPEEGELLAWLAERGIPALVVATKVDKLPLGRRQARLRALGEALGLGPEGVLATSVTKGLGLRELWSAIFEVLEG